MTRSAPLSADARRLLELGSQVEPPTAEQNERMDRALAPLFRAGRAGPSPATGSPLGGAEQRLASPQGDPSSAVGARGRAGEHSGIRLRAARRPSRLLEPLHGSRDAKIWLTLGALAATAGASFWLGRISTPADAAGALDAHAAESTIVQSRVAANADAEGAAAASSFSAIGVLESSLAPPALPSPAARAPAFPPPAALPPPVARAAPAPPSDAESRAPEAARGARGPLHASLARDKAGPRRDATRPQRASGLAAEIEQLARAEAALRQGRAQHALVVLEQRAVQHLHEQAAALRAIAECELGVAAAAANARDVLQRWPASAFEPRVVRACNP